MRRACVKMPAGSQPPPFLYCASYARAFATGCRRTINCVLDWLLMFMITGLARGDRVRLVLAAWNPEASSNDKSCPATLCT